MFPFVHILNATHLIPIFFLIHKQIKDMPQMAVFSGHKEKGIASFLQQHILD